MKTMSELTNQQKSDLYRDVAQHWGKGENASSLSKKYDLKESVVGGIPARIRKAGIPIPRLTHTALSEDFKSELADIFKNR